MRARLLQVGALVGESDHGVSKSLYAKDPDGIEFEVMWAVPRRPAIGPRTWAPGASTSTAHLPAGPASTPPTNRRPTELKFCVPGLRRGGR